MKSSQRGFTLLELMIQIAIFASIAALLVGITLVGFRVKNRSVADSEVLGQINFVMQAIQRMVRESTAIAVPDSDTLNLTRSGDTTTIELSGGTITLKEGVAAPTTDLTNNQVIVDNLAFTHITNTNAPDTVQISITMRFNTTNPLASTTRMLQSSASPLY